MKFRKYQHIERFGTDEVDGIEIGECLVFYKIDGTNASVWLDDGNIKAGSRKRELTLEKDNQGFYKHILNNENIKFYLDKHPKHRLYGEWLVPHSIKTYREDAWERFYIFDVTLDKNDGTVEYIPYDIYKPMLDEFDLEYIPPLAKIENPTHESLLRCLCKTGQFLIQDGYDKGEGIVIKNYDFYNKWGKQIWAKIVTTEFKEEHHKVMGCPEVKNKATVEEKIINDFVTEAFIEKEFAKIKNEKGWRSQDIPELFERIFHELITEESWNIVKKYNKPKINFKRLNNMTINKIKKSKPELFS